MRLGFLFFAALLVRADSLKPTFATYLGGGGNEVVGSVATDSQGNIYIAGRTDSPDFPVKNAIQPVSHAFSQIFIAKFSPAGELLYSTYYGGSDNDLATGIATDAAGNVYVTGVAPSRDFPVSNAFQAQNHGGTDAFALKLDASGAVVYATYLGGQFNDHGMAIAADASGNAYVTGRTESPDFPVTPGAFQTTPAGYHRGYTFVSAFVTKLDAAGNLVYSTFLGGNGYNVGWGIAVDAQGQAHVAGATDALDFPTTANAMQPGAGRQVTLGVGSSDAFLAKLAADGGSLVYSTYVGGPSQDTARSVSVDASGNAYITGVTSDARLPIVNGAQEYLGGDVLLVSGDGGASFSPRRTGLRAAAVTSIVFDPQSHTEYAGTQQGVFRSTDGGNTWSPAGLDAYWILHLEADRSAPGTIYAGTNYGGGLFRSTDGGDTWTSLNAGAPGETRGAVFSTFAVDPAGSGTVYAYAGFGGISSGYDQPLYRITDNGAKWTLVGKGLRTSPLSAVVSPDSQLFVGTTSFNFFGGFFGGGPSHTPGTVYRLDGETWVNGGGMDDDIHALAFQGNTLYAAGRNFYQSTDGGATWTQSPLPDGITAEQMAFDPNVPTTIYLTAGQALNARLLRSTDGGAHFETIGSQQLSAIAVNPEDSSLHAGRYVPEDAFVAGFGASGTLIYSTFLGGPGYERGDGVAVDASGNAYIAGFQGVMGYNGRTFVARADGSGHPVDLGASTAMTVLDMPSRGIAIAPDGSIVAVMIATEDGLPVENATQSHLSGIGDVYLVKWRP